MHAPAAPQVRRLWLGVGLLFLVGAALRFWRLAAAPLWHDEAFFAHMSSVPLRELQRLLPGDSEAPLFYLLLHLWIRLFGTSELSLRVMPALLGAVTPLVLLRAGRSLVGAPAAWIAAVLIAVAPEHIAMSREARMYTLMPLLAALTLWAAHGAATRGPLRLHLLWGGGAAALVWTHYWAVWFLLGLEVGVLALRRRAGFRRRWLWGHLLFLALVIPLLPLVREQAHHAGTDWMPHYSLHGGLRAAFLAFAGSGVALGASAAAGLAGLLYAARRRRLEGPLPAEAALLAATVFLPLIGALLASRWRPLFIPGRYTLSLLPSFCWGMGLLISRLPPPWRAGLTAGLVGVVAFTALPGVYRTPPRPYRAEGARIARELRPGDAIVYVGLGYEVFHYYVIRAAPGASEFLYPPGLALHSGWMDDAQEMRDPARRHQEAAALARDCLRLAKGGARVFVVIPPGLSVGEVLRDEFDRRLRLVSSHGAGAAAEILLYRAPASPFRSRASSAPAPPSSVQP